MIKKEEWTLQKRLAGTLELLRRKKIVLTVRKQQDELTITRHTVKKHLNNIYSK